jgi:hypothetical protein
MLSTYSYQLPALYAVDYGNEEKLVLADVEIDYGFYKVTTKAGTNFVAEIDENGGTIGITYKWKDAELHYDVKVLKVYEGIKLNIANYFLTDNTSIDANFSSFSEFIAVEDGDASWEFANPVLSEGFSMRLSSSDKPSTFKTIEITLTDTSNVEETLTVTLTRGANGLLEYTIPGSGNITGVKYDQYETPFNVSYSKGKIYLNNADLTAKTYDNGEPFNGFSSQYVYISAKVADAKAGERYRIHKLDNQAICSFASDFIEPRIVLNGEVGGYREINSIYTINTASFSDVLDPAIISSVEVKDPSGNHVTDVNGLVLNKVRCNRTYNIKLDQYGQYILIYRASDSTGNSLSYTFAVGVLNDIEPEIKITSSYDTEIKLGEIIVLPEYEVTINGEKPENVKILTYATIKTPSCYIAQLTGKNNSYKPNQVGEYEVAIYAMDDNGNVATFEYVVTVK